MIVSLVEAVAPVVDTIVAIILVEGSIRAMIQSAKSTIVGHQVNMAWSRERRVQIGARVGEACRA